MAGETAERSRQIAAPADAVWAVVGDVTRMPEWSEELASVDVLEGDGRSPGSRFRGNNKAEARAWSMTCVIDRYEEGRALEFHTENDKGEVRTRWWYRLGPAGDATAVTEGFERVAKLGKVRALAERKLLGDRTEYNTRNIDESLRRLAELVERPT
ncbi:MAG TPA: SRPBCC family protein [Acidimicrobiales bacterium]|nr:SRPBCC family protein [Acidimicrobiales bacterium]